MSDKGFEADISLNQTPNFEVTDEKPLKSNKIKQKKVDINVLKARAQEIQDKENRKNVFIFIFFFIILGAVVIYLSI